MLDADKLVPGITKPSYVKQKAVDRIDVEPGYPTADEPHRKLAGLGVDLTQGHTREQALARLMEESGKLGANAIVVVEDKPVAIVVVALRLSSAAPPAPKPAAELLPEAAKGLKDAAKWKRTGKAYVADLAAFQPLEIKAKRGTCYAVAVAIDKDAAWSEHATKGIELEYVSNDPYFGGYSPSWPKVMKAPARSDGAGIGCPMADGPLQIDLRATWGSATNSDRLHDLGTGAIHFQLYTRSASKSELADIKKRGEDAKAAGKQAARDQARRGCAACAAKLLTCVDPTDCPAYRTCLGANYVREDECSP